MTDPRVARLIGLIAGIPLWRDTFSDAVCDDLDGGRLRDVFSADDVRAAREIRASGDLVPAIRLQDITSITDALLLRSSKFAAFFGRAELEEHVAMVMVPHILPEAICQARSIRASGALDNDPQTKAVNSLVDCVEIWLQEDDMPWGASDMRQLIAEVIDRRAAGTPPASPNAPCVYCGSTDRMAATGLCAGCGQISTPRLEAAAPPAPDVRGLTEKLRRRVEEVYGGHGTVIEHPDDDCIKAAAAIEAQAARIAEIEKEVKIHKHAHGKVVLAYSKASVDLIASKTHIAELETHNDTMDERNVVLRKRIAELQQTAHDHNRESERLHRDVKNLTKAVCSSTDRLLAADRLAKAMARMLADYGDVPDATDADGMHVVEESGAALAAYRAAD